jgi:hypothetical protein
VNLGQIYLNIAETKKFQQAKKLRQYISKSVNKLQWKWLPDYCLQAFSQNYNKPKTFLLFSAQVIPACLFLLMGNLGCNAKTEIALLTIATFISGSASSGTLVNSVDLAPNFSGQSNFAFGLFYNQNFHDFKILINTNWPKKYVIYRISTRSDQHHRHEQRVRGSPRGRHDHSRKRELTKFRNNLCKKLFANMISCAFPNAAIYGAVEIRFHDSSRFGRDHHSYFHAFRKRRRAIVERTRRRQGAQAKQTHSQNQERSRK